VVWVGKSVARAMGWGARVVGGGGGGGGKRGEREEERRRGKRGKREEKDWNSKRALKIVGFTIGIEHSQ